MATTVMVKCNCGHMFTVYVPKAVLYGQLILETQEEVSEWEAVDAEEESQGEIEVAMAMAKATGFSFIDGRESKTFHCQCGFEHDPLEAMRGKQQ